jgi:Undecaprenyl-phosphate galactose phosphotransferase WbaP
MSAHAERAVAAGQIAAASPAPFRERHWAGALLAIGDLAALEISFLLGYLLRLAVRPWYPAELGPAQIYGIAAGLLLLPVAHFVSGLYPGYGLNPVERLRLRMRTVFTVLATLVVWDYLIQHGGWSRGVLLATVGFALVLPVIVEALLIGWLMSHGYWGTPVLVLGSGPAGVSAVDRLRKRKHLGLVPVLHLDISEIGEWTRRERRQEIRVAVVALPNLAYERLAKLVETLPFSTLIVIPEFSGLQSQWVTAVDLGGTLGLELRRNLLLRRNRWFKRAFDIAFGAPLFIAGVPVLVLFGLWVKLVSAGPALYVQVREGEGGKAIRVWKLRTMHLDADRRPDEPNGWNAQQRQEWERGFKLRNDPRVLPGVGSLLRRSSLDELPQLWNVLRGEMSLVGPRPLPFYHLERFDPEFCQLRRKVRPGITGLWQVTGRSDGDLRGHQPLDTYYIRNWSFWMDLHILACTLRAVWKGTGAY